MLQIDLAKCTKCGSCARACTAYVIEMQDPGPVEVHPGNCIECGHCVAVCPVNAIVHEHMDASGFPEMEEPGITFKQFNQLARNRRSIRRFKSELLSKEHAEQILESVRYIPTAENAQELEYLFITDPERVGLIRNEMLKGFKMAFSLVKHFYWIVKSQTSESYARRSRLTGDIAMKKWTDREKTHEDPFFHNAPALLIVHAPKKKVKGITSFAVNDAGIAGYHVLIACETLGIGTCWSGYHTKFANMYGSVRKASLVPKGHMVIASILMGYPAIKYKRDVYRKPLHSRIVGPGDQ
nr:nitroreductase family protein [Candidatus Sigynarchaeota archaeon]